MNYQEFVEKFAAAVAIPPAELRASVEGPVFSAVAPCGTFAEYHTRQEQWMVSWNGGVGRAPTLEEAERLLNIDAKERYEAFLEGKGQA